MLRLGLFTMDIALMSFGPAYQISLNSILLTDKSHTSSSGQYLDLIHTPVRSKDDVIVVLFRRVSKNKKSLLKSYTNKIQHIDFYFCLQNEEKELVKLSSAQLRNLIQSSKYANGTPWMKLKAVFC